MGRTSYQVGRIGTYVCSAVACAVGLAGLALIADGSEGAHSDDVLGVIYVGLGVVGTINACSERRRMGRDAGSMDRSENCGW
jgi:hypothetical protein